MRKNNRWHMPLLLLLAGVLLVAWYVVDRIDRGDKQNREELLAQAAPLERERDRLVAQRDRQERQFQEDIAVPATEQLLFLEMDPLIYSEIYPKMAERQIPGMLALYPGNLPGAPGCLPREEFDQLVAAGWELCLYCEGTEDFTRWDQEMSGLLAEMGIEKPRAVYFPEDAFLPGQTEEIRACGYTAAVHHGEGSLRLIAGEAGEDLWLTGAHPWNYTGVREEIQAVVNQGGEHCFTVRFSEGREEYLPNGFQSMLEFIEPYQQNGSLVVTGLMAARDMHDPAKNGADAVREEWERQDAALVEEIRLLDQQIQAIYARWNGEEHD